MPDAIYPVNKLLIDLSQVTTDPLVLTPPKSFSTLRQWFTFVHLSTPHMTHNCAFSIMLTTLALYQSSLWLFKACSCKPALRGPPSSVMQLQHFPCLYGAPVATILDIFQCPLASLINFVGIGLPFLSSYITCRIFLCSLGLNITIPDV